jgi:phosphate transport system substrate-binding protein
VNRNVLGGRVLAGVALVAIALAGCSSKNEPGTGSSDAPKLSGAVRVDGSSTVAPLSEAAADLYKAEQAGVQVTVATSGTGAGFEKFCNGETDISDASRPISQKEKDACAAKGIVYQELLAANDALTVVVSKQNDWVDCLTTAELKKIWEPSSAVTNWNQVRAGFPDQPLGQGQLFGAGTDSGTFDYFTEVINGKSKASRTNYTASENDNVLVQGVAGTKSALGYFGFSYSEENTDKLQALKIDGGNGCVEPSVKAAQDGTYKPLARPLFIYVNKSSLAKPQVVDFVDFYVENIDEIVTEAKFVPLTAAQKTTLADEYKKIKG